MKNKITQLRINIEYIFTSEVGQMVLYKITRDFKTNKETTWVRFGKSHRYRKFTMEAFNCLEMTFVGSV